MDDTMRRGDIYFAYRTNSNVGSEMRDGRPAIIVSNDYLNQTSDIVECVYTTTKQKRDLPTHAEINTTRFRSWAVCEQIVSIAKERLGDYVGHVTDEEMHDIDKCLEASLSIGHENAPVHETMEIVRDKKDDEIAELTFRANLYKDMYEDLLNKIIAQNS